jgi:hypothetical protein
MKTVITFNSSLPTSPRSRSILVLIALTLVSFVLAQGTQAVNPPPDGGYAGGNTAEGQNALLSFTGGTFNTAVGLFSLRSNAENMFNTAIGAGALLANTANDNTATGAAALLSNTTGTDNMSVGGFALLNNTTGTDNAALGASALLNSTTGGGNTAVGFNALLTTPLASRIRQSALMPVLVSREPTTSLLSAPTLVVRTWITAAS